MKPRIHAKVSAKRFGGIPEDYMDIHNFIDQSKMAMPDIRHRAILHSAFGCFLVEQMFGTHRVNTAGKEYSPRDVAEEHIIEDLGFIPTVERWLDKMPIEGWMSGTLKHRMAHKTPEEKGKTTIDSN
jgi:hypothetical protein